MNPLIRWAASYHCYRSSQMSLISNPTIREQIALSLDAVPKLIPELSQQDITLEQVDAFCQVLIAEHRNSVAEQVSKRLDYELGIAYYGALATGLMSLAIEEKNPPVIAPTWINASSTPDPNLVFSKMLVNIANYVLGVIHLVEDGLESQARTNLRILLELSWLALATLAKRDKMALYAQDHSDDVEREIYHKHFSPRKLQQAVTEIETNAGFPEDAKKILSGIRSEMYSMYSKTVHNSYTGLILGAMSYSFEDETQLFSNLFGRADKASYPTLHHMNDALFYFFGMAHKVLDNIHRLKPPYTFQWQRVLAMQESFSYIIRHRASV